MSVIITALYAGLLAVVGLVLSGMAGMGRTKTGVPLGLEGGGGELLERVRRHGNFIENAPFALLLLLILELNGTSVGMLHGLGLALLVGRILHPFGVSAESMKSPFRMLGMLLTMAMMLVASCMLVWQYTGIMLAS